LPTINNWDDDPSRIKKGKKVSEDFVYNSSTNTKWMTPDELEDWLENNKDKMGQL